MKAGGFISEVVNMKAKIVVSFYCGVILCGIAKSVAAQTPDLTTETEITTQPKPSMTTEPYLSTSFTHSKTTTENNLTTVPSSSGVTTGPVNSNLTTHIYNMTTQPANVSSEASSVLTTLPSIMTSQFTMTSTLNTIPTTTHHAASPSQKKEFNAWDFLGGVALGLLVTLACIGLVYFYSNRSPYSNKSVQYRAMEH